MTKKPAVNLTWMQDRLINMGIDRLDVEKLWCIQCALSRWSEHECNGNIQREELPDGKEGKPRWYYNIDGPGPIRSYPIPDRERGALKRLEAVMSKYPSLSWYNQGDPRGCSLYIYEKAKLPAGKDIDCYYSSVAIAVCY